MASGNRALSGGVVSYPWSLRRQDILSALPYVLGALLLAGATELLLLRVLSRVAVHIPKEGLVLQAFALLTDIGSFAFNLSTVLGMVALALAAYAVWSAGRQGLLRTIALAGLATLLLWGLLLPLVGQTDITSLLFASTSVAIMGLLALGYSGQAGTPIPRRLAVVLVVGAYAASQYFVASQNAYVLLGLSASPPYALTVFGAGEALVLLNGIVVFWAWGRPLRRDIRLVPATAITLVFLFSYLSNTSTSAILSLWAEGLILHLPLPLYLIALWLYLVTATGLLKNRQTLYQGVAWLLLFVAGYTLEMTYQHLLAVLAVLLLTQGEESLPPLTLSRRS